MTGIRFSFSEMLQELESARGLMSPFLENADSVFPQIRKQLEGLREKNGKATLNWHIEKEPGLRTIISRGEHEPGGGGIRVLGKLSFVWEIARINPAKKSAPAQHFELLGVASTVARVFAVNADDSPGDELAMWRIETGDLVSPGCHFHSQIRGEGDPPFPSNLSVPRLPTCFASPMAGLEFLLGELFQDEWSKRVARDSDHLKMWRSIQRRRFTQLFTWHKETIGTTTTSPWYALKCAKPVHDIFLNE